MHGLLQTPGGLSSALHEGAAPPPLGAVCSESHPAFPPGCLLANPPVHTLPPLLCVFLTQKGRQTVVNTGERRLDVFKKQMILKHLDFGVSVTLGGKKVMSSDLKEILYWLSKMFAHGFWAQMKWRGYLPVTPAR